MSSSNLTTLFKGERNTHYLKVLWQNWIKTPFKRYFKPETHWCCTEQILSYVKIKYLSYCNFDPHSWLIYEKVRSCAAAVHTSNTVHCAFLLARSNIPTYCQVLFCFCKWDIKHNGGTSLYQDIDKREDDLVLDERSWQKTPSICTSNTIWPSILCTQWFWGKITQIQYWRNTTATALFVDCIDYIITF